MEEFVRRNLGDEVFERLIEPFCSGDSLYSIMSIYPFYFEYIYIYILYC